MCPFLKPGKLREISDNDFPPLYPECAHGVSMVLENIPENMNRDMLSFLVGSVSGLDEGSFTLEIIWETKKAVVTLNNPTGRNKLCLQYTCLHETHLVATGEET